jgi:hypothetical protein
MPLKTAAISRVPGLFLRVFVLAAMLALSHLASCQAPSGDTGTAAVVIEHQTSDGVTLYSTTYRAAHDNCTITWIAYNYEPGVVKYKRDCPAPLAQQLPLLHSICATFLSQDRHAAAFHTLFWGRLAPDSTASSREMSFRVAAAAFRSEEWDKRRGQPKHGDINRFTRDLANQARIYPELQELFTDFHLTVTLSHVEKVLVERADQLSCYPQLVLLGAKAADLLPFDCMAWFAVAIDNTPNN